VWITGRDWYAGNVRFFGRDFRDRGDAAARHRPFILMMDAQHFGNRRDADGLLVEATRWLKAHPYDAVIHEACNSLRAKFLPVR